MTPPHPHPQWLPDDLVIPGMAPEATPVVAVLIERAVAAGIETGLKRYEEGTCTRRCDRISTLEERQDKDRTALYGTPDSPIGGIVGRVRDLEGRTKLLLWLAGTSGGAAIASLITLVLTLALQRL